VANTLCMDHTDLLQELFSRIGRVSDVKLRYDRAGRSDGQAFVSYERLNDANKAIREFDGANAKGQPIRLVLMPPPRRDNPFDRVENPRSLFDRIEAPRARRRSESPISDSDDRNTRRGNRRGDRNDARRSDTTKPAPDNIDRYVPGQNGGRSDSRRGGRRPGERRERGRGRDDGGHKLVGGRPRKTQEELDAEMDDYWSGNAGANGQSNTAGANASVEAPAQNNAAPADAEIDMMIE
jgi:THO complex subunit 4